MKDKNIIAFYGNTGSGKSTSINYFMDVPLEITKNDFGLSIVKLKEYKKGYCTIGHSNVLS